MTSLHDRGCEIRRWLPLITFALQEGWSVTRTPSGGIRFAKAGMPAIRSGPSTNARYGDQTVRLPQERISSSEYASETDHA